MIIKMLQVNGARVSAGSAPTITTPLSLLPVGVRGGDTITINGTTLPVTQLVSQLFNLTIRASDTIALKIRIPARSVEGLSDDSPLPVSSIPLKLTLGSAAGSVSGVKPILTPDAASASLSAITVDKEVVLDGIPIILDRDAYVEISDISVVPSSLVGVPFVNLNLDALVIPPWIVERTAGEWLGKSPLPITNSTVALNTNQLNRFLATPIGNDVRLMIQTGEGDDVLFVKYSATTRTRAEFRMTIPRNAVMIALQRDRLHPNADELPDLRTSTGWESSWRSAILPDANSQTSTRRAPIRTASFTLASGQIPSFNNWGVINQDNSFSGAVQFVIIYNPTWPEEGLPELDARLGLRLTTAPRLSPTSTAAIGFDEGMNLVLDGRNCSGDPFPYNQRTSLLSKGIYRSAIMSPTFESGDYTMFMELPTAWMPTQTQILLPDTGTSGVSIDEVVSFNVRTSNPSGDVLAVSSSGAIGATSKSTCRHQPSGMFIHLPMIISWAAQI